MTTFDQCTGYIRTYAYPVKKDEKKQWNRSSNPSEKQRALNEIIAPYGCQVLTIDTETTMGNEKTLLYGWAMLTGYSQKEIVRLFDKGELTPLHRDTLRDFIVFYNPSELTSSEIACIKEYAESISLVDVAKKLGVPYQGSATERVSVMTTERFVNVLYALMRFQQLLILGVNTPFDLSRLATRWFDLRDEWSGGFGFKLCTCTFQECYTHPSIRIKKMGYARARYGMSRSQYSSKQKKRSSLPVFKHAYFLDLMQLSSALLGKAMGLEELGEKLAIPEHLRKYERPLDDYRPNSTETLDYASQDIYATFASYQKLRDLYRKHNLSTPMWNMFSGASLGKAIFKEIGFKSFFEVHPDFPKDVVGYAMNSYYGGRSEIAVRLQPVEGRLRDFSGEYPVACALMGMQDFWLATDIEVRRNELQSVQAHLCLPVSDLLEKLHTKEFWKYLTCLVKVVPCGKDRLPLRTEYGKRNEEEEESRGALNIALPYVKGVPTWYTLADVIASKLLTDHTPTIVDAIRLVPGEERYTVQPFHFMGEALIDPNTEDFFIKVGDLRNTYKKLAKRDPFYETLEKALKLVQNSTAYGSQVEINQSEETSVEHEVIFFDNDGIERHGMVTRVETPGKYFSPLGTFIPASGRLMLAIAQRLYSDRGIMALEI